MNEGLRHHVADLLFGVLDWLAGPEARRAARARTEHLAQRVLDLARRNPGRRVLVVVNVRHCHHLRAALRHRPEVDVVRYSELWPQHGCSAGRLSGSPLRLRGAGPRCG